MQFQVAVQHIACIQISTSDVSAEIKICDTMIWFKISHKQ